jgi:predicted MFS family arabinose efflux permease
MAPIDRGRWRAVLGFTSLGLWWGTWGALVPAIQQRAGVSDGGLGLALAFVGVGALTSMRATGTLIDRYGDAVLPVAIVLFALAGVSPALAEGTLALSAAMAAVGVTSGAVDVAIDTAAVDVENATGRQLMNLAHGAFSLAVITASASTGVLRAADASAILILAMAGLALVVCGVAVARRQSGTVQEDVTSSRLRISWWRPPRRLLLIGVLTALAYLVESSWQNWSAVHLERDVGASPLVGSLGPALFGAAAAAGRLGGHRLEGRHDRHALLRTGALLAALGTVVAALAPWSVAVLVGIGFAGLGTAVCAPILLGLAGAGVTRDRRGAAIGTVTTLAYLGFVLAPAGVGALAAATTLPTAMALIAAAALTLAVAARTARPATYDESV